MFSSSRRTLVQALTISLLIHAALLSSVVSLFPVMLDEPATTINVVMGQGNRDDSVKTDAVPAAKPLPEKVNPPLPDTVKSVARRNVISQDLSVAHEVPSAQTSARDAGPTASTPPAPVGRVPGGGAAASVAPGREGASADDMRQYRLSLASAARRFKRYPPLAKERGWEGTVDVALDVNALLPVPEVVLVRSSGRSVLDEQALEMMLQAARVTVMPEGLKGRDFRVLLPVKFNLDGDQ